mgnify:CR=1 FL=1
MKKAILTTFLLHILILSFSQNSDYTLSKVKTISGKLIFHNLEPFDAFQKVFMYENKIKIEDNTIENDVLTQTVKDALVESGLQGGEAFDAIILKDGEPRARAIKFTTKSDKNALAKIGTIDLGVYIFEGGTEPSNPHDFIATINVRWHKDPEEWKKARLELIERSKKKYPNFDGMIIKDNTSADLIKFRGLEITGGGFRVGDKAIYKSGAKPAYGEIMSLDNTKQEAGFKFYNEYGDENMKNINYTKLSAVTNDQYDNYIKTQNIEIQKHKFSIGEKVIWSDGKSSKYGEVTSQNAKKHDATVTFLNIYGENKTDDIDFLKLDKLDATKFQELRDKELIEIKKHQFEVGQKVSFVKDKTPKCGEVVSLNNANHKATIKYLGVFAEDKTTEDQYLDIEKISDEKYNADLTKSKQDAQKYKFTVGEKIYWNKGSLLSKSEQISAEVVALDEAEHKATIKFTNKDNAEKQEKVSYLDLSKVK